MHNLSLNVIGAGKVGSVLAKLLHQHHCFDIKGVVNTHHDSAERAVAFIGAGVAYDALCDLPIADVCMIAASDTQLERIASNLAKHPNIVKTKIAFHCSGIQPAALLAPLAEKGVKIASIHPVMTFAAPDKVVENFAGTYCGFEGDIEAFDVLCPIFERMGGHFFKISADQKDLYHAANVMACNYLVALMDVAIALYQGSGIPEQEVHALMRPLVSQTLENFFGSAAPQSLTGPIARGDYETVKRHLRVIQDEKIWAVYTALGARTLEIAVAKGGVSQANLGAVENALNTYPHQQS